MHLPAHPLVAARGQGADLYFLLDHTKMYHRHPFIYDQFPDPAGMGIPAWEKERTLKERHSHQDYAGI